MQEEHPFAKHKQIFQAVKKEDRPKWLREMLQTPQGEGPCPEFTKPYPSQGKWMYMGNQLHYQYAKNTNKKPSAIFFYFHGMNAHGGGSGYYAMSLVEKCGVDAYAPDFTNFGQSKGPFRGYFESVEHLVTEAQEFMKHILSQYEEKPKVFISGLSLGGAICFWLALRRPSEIAGVMFLSPALRDNSESQPFMKKMGWMLGKVCPRLLFVPQTFKNQNKRDATQRIMQDPHVYKDKVVPGSVKAVLEAMQTTEAHWKEFNTPYILIQSGCDKLVDPFQALDFEEASQSTDKTVIYCKDMWHAVFSEEEMPAITEIMGEWLQKRIKQ